MSFKKNRKIIVAAASMFELIEVGLAVFLVLLIIGTVTFGAIHLRDRQIADRIRLNESCYREAFPNGIL